jgi:carotenoid cleavage dioxygenase
MKLSPYVSTLHDMVLTQKYMIFPVYGYVTSMERLRAGQLHWAFDKNMPTYWGFVPRENVRGRPIFIYYTFFYCHLFWC